METLFKLSDKVIVVTGATGVLAGGAAKYLQEQGARVVYGVRCIIGGADD